MAEFHRLCELLPERRLQLIDGVVLEALGRQEYRELVDPLGVLPGHRLQWQ